MIERPTPDPTEQRTVESGNRDRRPLPTWARAAARIMDSPLLDRMRGIGGYRLSVVFDRLPLAGWTATLWLDRSADHAESIEVGGGRSVDGPLEAIAELGRALAESRDRLRARFPPLDVR